MNKTNDKLKDHSRFNRWIQDMDEKDKSLTPLVRKSKWLLILTSVFVLFGLSFIVFPTAKINAGALKTTIETNTSETDENKVTSAFELPVELFENQLKRIIHEEFSEKE